MAALDDLRHADTVPTIDMFAASGGPPLVVDRSTGKVYTVTSSGAIRDTGTGTDFWTAYTPTITASAGTFTTVSGSGRYLVQGKIVHFTIEVVITTNGTAAGQIIATLPFPNVNMVRHAIGREDTLTGYAVVGLLEGGPNVKIMRYDDSYPGGDGKDIRITGSYEIA